MPFDGHFPDPTFHDIEDRFPSPKPTVVTNRRRQPERLSPSRITAFSRFKFHSCCQDANRTIPRSCEKGDFTVSQGEDTDESPAGAAWACASHRQAHTGPGPL